MASSSSFSKATSSAAVRDVRVCVKKVRVVRVRIRSTHEGRIRRPPISYQPRIKTKHALTYRCRVGPDPEQCPLVLILVEGELGALDAELPGADEEVGPRPVQVEAGCGVGWGVELGVWTRGRGSVSATA